MDIHWVDRDNDRFKVTVENEQDLWYLSRVIGEDDLIEGQTERKVDMGDDSKSRTVRKTFYLGIGVESVSYDPETKSFRASGRINQCPDDVSKGSYHSFNVQPGDTITVEKEALSTFHVKQLEEATTPPSDIILVLVDRNTARFARITPHGYDVITAFEGSVEKKAYDQVETEDFHGRVGEYIESLVGREDASTVVLASPGFWKENVVEALPDGLDAEVVLGTVSRTDNQGFDELLKRPEVETALEKEQSSREARVVEELMEAVHDERACYGFDETSEKVTMGSVETLLLTEEFLADQKRSGGYEDIDALMKKVEEMGGEVVILGSDDQMRKVDGLGGIAAILRWKA